MVLESDDVWMVEFFAPWCGHCKKWVWFRSVPSSPPLTSSSLRGNWPMLLYNRGSWKSGWKGAQQVLLISFFIRIVVSSLWPLLSSVVNSLEPEWAAAATAVKEQTKGRVRLGAVDATVHQAVSSRYGVSEGQNVWAKTKKIVTQFKSHQHTLYFNCHWLINFSIQVFTNYIYLTTFNYWY